MLGAGCTLISQLSSEECPSLMETSICSFPTTKFEETQETFKESVHRFADRGSELVCQHPHEHQAVAKSIIYSTSAGLKENNHGHFMLVRVSWLRRKQFVTRRMRFTSLRGPAFNSNETLAPSACKLFVSIRSQTP